MIETFIPAKVPHNEQERLLELRRYNILDSDPEPPFDFLTRIASRLFDMPIALVSLVDEKRQWFKSKVGIDATETPRDLAFCAHAILGNEVFMVRDAHADVRFAGNPLVLGEPYVRFYAGAPVHLPTGQNLGTLCVIDVEPRDMSWEEQKVLSGLADLVVDEFELRHKCAQLEDEKRLLGAEQQRAREAMKRLEKAQYNFITERVGRELGNFAATSQIAMSLMP